MRTHYKTLMRQHLEYANQTLNPRLKYNLLPGRIYSVEQPSRSLWVVWFTAVDSIFWTPRLKNLGDDLEEWLKCLKLSRGSMIQLLLETFYAWMKDTRGNSCKIKGKDTKDAVRKNFFTVAAVNDWSSLPEDVVTSESINIFKSRLD